MSEMRIIDGSGDTRLIWDAHQSAEVDNARRTFDELRRKKYNAYSVKKDGSQGKVITEFDPDAEKIILAPPMSGG